MQFIFTPRKLIQSKEDIVIQHPLESEMKSFDYSDTKLKNLIIRLSRLELYQVKMSALALSDEEMAIVTGYLPFNYYNVEMKNLFMIFQYRSNKVLCNLLYNQWQDSYDNEECNRYIVDELLYKNENYIMLIRKHHMDEMQYAHILGGDDDISIAYGKELKKHIFARGSSLKDKLTFFGVRFDSRLYHDCEFFFFTFCEKEDYLAVDDLALLKVISKYNESTLKVFLNNFLAIMTLRELERFAQLADFMNRRIGENIDIFFENFLLDIKEKYIDWINTYKVNQYFGYDERSVFWKKYKFKSVSKYKYSDSVVMEFEKYIAIEFLGKAMGPIYIYDKEYYIAEVKQWFTNRYYDNADMRSKLYNGTDYEHHGYRKIHNGYWQGDVNRYLIRNRITEHVN